MPARSADPQEILRQTAYPDAKNPSACNALCRHHPAVPAVPLCLRLPSAVLLRLRLPSAVPLRPLPVPACQIANLIYHTGAHLPHKERRQKSNAVRSSHASRINCPVISAFDIACRQINPCFPGTPPHLQRQDQHKNHNT